MSEMQLIPCTVLSSNMQLFCSRDDDDVANFAMLVPGARATLCLVTDGEGCAPAEPDGRAGGRKRPPCFFAITLPFAFSSNNMFN